VKAFRLEREASTARAARCIEVARHKVGRATGDPGPRTDWGQGFHGARSIDLANPEPYAADARKQARGVLTGE